MFHVSCFMFFFFLFIFFFFSFFFFSFWVCVLFCFTLIALLIKHDMTIPQFLGHGSKRASKAQVTPVQTESSTVRASLKIETKSLCLHYFRHFTTVCIYGIFIFLFLCFYFTVSWQFETKVFIMVLGFVIAIAFVIISLLYAVFHCFCF